MAATRYLRQLGTGHLYVWTETLAKRKDMVPFDPELAKKRIEALKMDLETRQAPPSEEEVEKHQADLAAAQAIANEQTDLENKIEKASKAPQPGESKKEPGKALTDEEIEESVRQEKIAADPHVQQILAMTNKEEVAGYCLKEFGTEVDKRQSIETLKGLAVDMRADRIFEK